MPPNSWRTSAGKNLFGGEGNALQNISRITGNALELVAWKWNREQDRASVSSAQEKNVLFVSGPLMLEVHPPYHFHFVLSFVGGSKMAQEFLIQSIRKTTNCQQILQRKSEIFCIPFSETESPEVCQGIGRDHNNNIHNEFNEHSVNTTPSRRKSTFLHPIYPLTSTLCRAPWSEQYNYEVER